LCVESRDRYSATRMTPYCGGIENMTNSFFLTMLGLLAIVTLPAGEAHADTFEFLTYTPPRGWINQASQDGNVYRRTSGIGLITFYASYPSTGSASDEFVRMWRARIEPILPGAAPKPQLQPDGDYVAAVGAQRVDAQGTITTISLVAIVGRGRAIGVLTMAAGDEALREVTAFLDSLDVAPGTPAATTPKSGSVPAGEIEVEFDAPPGYVSRRDGRMVVLTPTTVDEKTPCAYGVSPARPSKGMLEAGQPSSKRCPVGSSRAIATTRCEALRAPGGATSGSAPMFKDSLGEATNTPRQ
jgi:hypothetical protein